jgi:hypothetical protein
VRLRLDREAERLVVRVDAPFHGDPAPAQLAGRLDRLWEHEVVELFLVGGEDRYLEIELGPHGHHLGLALAGARRIVDPAIGLEFRAVVSGRRWTGEARLAARDLPAGLSRWNAFAMHGVGDARRYLAARPVPGPQPDFHRIGLFPALTPKARDWLSALGRRAR